MQIGCGAFTGCHALEKLTVHMRQGKKSGVKEMLGEMWQRIDVNFLYEYEEARLVFPEHYDEAVENTPARICIRNIMDQAVITGSVFMIRS